MADSLGLERFMEEDETQQSLDHPDNDTSCALLHFAISGRIIVGGGNMSDEIGEERNRLDSGGDKHRGGKEYKSLHTWEESLAIHSHKHHA